MGSTKMKFWPLLLLFLSCKFNTLHSDFFLRTMFVPSLLRYKFNSTLGKRVTLDLESETLLVLK